MLKIYDSIGNGYDEWEIAELIKFINERKDSAGIIGSFEKHMEYMRENIQLKKQLSEIDKTIAPNHKVFERGVRVLVRNTAGFHRGAKGIIEFVEPNGTVWVVRDGSNTPCWYKQEELQFEDE